MSDAPKPRRQLEIWLLPLLIIAFCVAAIWLSTMFDRMPPILKRGIQPADFPQLVLVTIICLTLAMVWFDPIEVAEKLRGRTVGTLALFGLFAALTWVDFFLALAAFAAALTVVWGERRLVMVCFVGLVVPTSIFFLFDQVFEIRFPRGLITNLWYG